MTEFKGRLFGGRLFAGRLFRGQVVTPSYAPPAGGPGRRQAPLESRRTPATRRDRDDDVLLFLLR